MALTKVKTWVAKSLYLPAASSAVNQNKNVIYNLKQVMVADFGWVVVGSSDSTAADSITPGSHYTDRWTTNPSGLVYTYTGSGSRAHSWIVLENTSIGTHFQICIDCDSNSSGNAGLNQSFVCSSTGQFSGGSTTARPTATDEVVTSSQGRLTTGVASACFVSAAQSSDGQCFRWLQGINSPQSATHAFLIEAVQGAPSWWTEKWVTGQATAAVEISPATRTAWLSSTAVPKLCAPINGAANLRTVRALEEGFNHEISSATGYGGMARWLPYTDANGDCIASPVGVYIADTVQRGFLGTLFDAYWVSPNMVSGVPVPGTGVAWGWVKKGEVLWGWDGSAPIWVERAYA